MSSSSTIFFPEAPQAIRLASFGPPPVSAHLLDEAEQAGYQRGLEESLLRHNQQILQMRGEMRHLQDDILHRLEDQYAQQLGELNRRLPELVMELLRRVLGRLEIDRSTLLGLIEEVLRECAPDEETLRVQLHPEDLGLLEENDGGLRQRHPRLSFEARNDLARGDCRIASRFGLIDATRATQLRQIEEEFSRL